MPAAFLPAPHGTERRSLVCLRCVGTTNIPYLWPLPSPAAWETRDKFTQSQNSSQVRRRTAVAPCRVQLGHDLASLRVRKVNVFDM